MCTYLYCIRIHAHLYREALLKVRKLPTGGFAIGLTILYPPLMWPLIYLRLSRALLHRSACIARTSLSLCVCIRVPRQQIAFLNVQGGEKQDGSRAGGDALFQFAPKREGARGRASLDLVFLHRLSLSPTPISSGGVAHDEWEEAQGHERAREHYHCNYPRIIFGGEQRAQGRKSRRRSRRGDIVASR